MFTGHFSVALAGAGVSRRVSLGLLITAAFGADILEGIIAIFGVRDVTRMWSHSLPATAAIGLVLGLLLRLSGGSWRDAGLVFLVAFSHTALDFVTAVKTVWPGMRPAGLDLYRHPYLDALVEGVCCVAGWLVWRSSLAHGRRSTVLVWSMLGMLLAVQGAVLIGARNFGPIIDPDALSKFVR